MRLIKCTVTTDLEILADDDCSHEEAIDRLKPFFVCESEKCNVLKWNVTDLSSEEICR
jgi:hypothetical protein